MHQQAAELPCMVLARAGEDLIYMVSTGHPYGCTCSHELTAVVMKASLRCSTFPMPSLHHHMHGTAMTAARGKLYMLGGMQLGCYPRASALQSSLLEVFDPHINSWFAAAPLPDHAQIAGAPAWTGSPVCRLQPWHALATAAGTVPQPKHDV